MRMRTLASIAGFLLILSAAPAFAQTVSLITTPSGSINNSAGAAIAKIVTDKAKLRMVVQAQASTGFDELAAGSGDFNISNASDVTFVVTGTGDYEGQDPKPNIRAVATLMPYRLALFVRADSDIRTIADLKGKRVGSGFNAQKTVLRQIEAYLANGGVSYKDVIGMPTPNVVSQANDFKSGKVDVLFFALGSAAVKEAAATVGGLRVLPADDSPEALRRAQALVPGNYLLTVNPAPGLDGVTQPTKILGIDMVLSTNEKVAEDAVYRVVKALHESKGELAAVFPPFALFSPEQMAKAVKDARMHPGAAKFYREVGIAPRM
jgi:TRAP transporter TAXI family solute receptor